MLKATLRRPTGIAIILVLALIAILILGFARTAFSANPTAVIKQFEGFSSKPYKDAGHYSVGYGHQILPGESMGRVTAVEAEELLASDIGWAEDTIDRCVTVNINNDARAALISLCYNIGDGAFRKSTLLKKLNRGDYKGAKAEFARWNRSKGKVSSALMKRRAKEAKLFGTGY